MKEKRFILSRAYGANSLSIKNITILLIYGELELGEKIQIDILILILEYNRLNTY